MRSKAEVPALRAPARPLSYREASQLGARRRRSRGIATLAGVTLLVPAVVLAGALLNRGPSGLPGVGADGSGTPLPGSPSAAATYLAASSGGARPTATAVGSSPASAVATAVATGVASGAPQSASPTATGAATANPTLLPTAVPTVPPPLPGSQPLLPVRAAFYYPWFPESWKQQGMDPFTKYHPSLGWYDSSASATIKAHIKAMQYGGIQVGISSWWGAGTKSDSRLPTILANTAGSAFRWSIYYEGEAYGNPSVSQIASDLRYIRDHYAANAGFFKVNGRFVVFVYADGGDACGMATRWAQANAGINAYIVLKVFVGYKTCADQPAGWHQYSPAKAADSQPGYSYAIAPGFWLATPTPTAPVLARDLTRWAQNVRAMVASHAPFQLITTFNEWGEGTAVESATEWASASGYGAYLDLLHTNGQ
jgi:Glycosyl hydrolase family 99